MNSYKAVFLGEGRVGKTSIGLKWSRGEFDPQRKSTVQAGLYSKKVETSKGMIELHLWDTAGQEEFHAIAPIYYKEAQAALLVYSVVDQRSFERMVQWHKELRQIRGDEVKIVVVANKIDMVNDRVIPSQKGIEYARSIGCNHFEVSAKTGEGIDMLFRYLTETLVSTTKANTNRPTKGRKGLMVLEAEETQEDNGKCSC
ncbi:Ras-related protein Rab-21 [Histomonas meleagridis]|uniref:Ras-related protein Rab-21 n=1 Tax=Histomonas meleagridis TaxID=135588 RepID=UPI00355A9E81|nr:Ras-related protein Rab-21 [Histomonas meleagridis]KAH0802059.1 Ras-related protein Rab-21 [Histomonas meleagridis]